MATIHRQTFETLNFNPFQNPDILLNNNVDPDDYFILFFLHTHVLSSLNMATIHRQTFETLNFKGWWNTNFM